MLIGTARPDRVTFLLAESDGKIALVCLSDHERYVFDTLAEAKEFSKTYKPKYHETN